MKHRNQRCPQIQLVANAVASASAKRLSKRAKQKLARAGKGFDTLAADPSSTLTLRKAFLAKLRVQFALLKERLAQHDTLSTRTVVGNDSSVFLSADVRDPEKHADDGSVFNCQPGQLRGADGRCGPGIGLGISRDDMPQIPANKLSQFIAWCRQQGVGVSEEQTSVHEMQPVQQDFRQGRVDAISDDAMTQPVVVCHADGVHRILDGTHRWVKAWQDGTPTLPVIALDLSVDEALRLMRRFMHVKFAANVAVDDPRTLTWEERHQPVANDLSDVPDVQQLPNGCGPACMKAAADSLGVVKPLSEWTRLLGTDKDGTSPAKMMQADGVDGLRLDARHGLAVADLARLTKDGQLILCPIQSDGGDGEESGHWVVVLEVRDGFVIIQDPSISNILEDADHDVAASGKVMIEEEAWVEAWRDVDADGNVFDRYGIVVSRDGVENANPNHDEHGRFAVGDEVHLPIKEDWSDLSTLHGQLREGNVEDGWHVAEPKVVKVTDGKAEVKKDLHAEWNSGRKQYVITKKEPEQEPVKPKSPLDGLKLPPMSKEHIKQVEDLSRKLTEELPDKLWTAHHLTQQYQQGTLGEKESGLDELARGKRDKPTGEDQNLAQRTHEHFQPVRDLLKRLIGDHVTLYRGADDVGGVPGKKLSSYAADPKVAAKFLEGYDVHGNPKQKVLKEVSVPVDAIWMAVRSKDRPLEFKVDNEKLPKHLSTNLSVPFFQESVRNTVEEGVQQLILSSAQQGAWQAVIAQAFRKGVLQSFDAARGPSGGSRTQDFHEGGREEFLRSVAQNGQEEVASLTATAVGQVCDAVADVKTADDVERAWRQIKASTSSAIVGACEAGRLAGSEDLGTLTTNELIERLPDLTVAVRGGWDDLTRLDMMWNVEGDNCGIGPGGFQPGNTCAKGEGGESGKVEKQVPTESPATQHRIDQIKREAAGIEVTDEDVDRTEVGSRDYDEIEERMTASEHSDMEKYLEHVKEEAVDQLVDDADIDVDERKLAEANDLSADDIETKADALFAEHDLEAPSLRGRDWGADGIDKCIDSLDEDAPAELKEQLEEWKKETTEEMERLKTDEEERLRDQARDRIENDYDDTDDKREYLREFHRDNEDRYQSSDCPAGSWCKDGDGDGVYQFKTTSGRPYQVNAVFRKVGNMIVPDMQFSDLSESTGSFKVTGKGDALEVFARVVPAMVAYLQKNDLPVATFSAAEPSRQRLYDRLVKTVATVLPDYFAAATVANNGGKYYVVGKRELREKLLKLAKAGLHLDESSEMEMLVNSTLLPFGLQDSWWTENAWEGGFVFNANPNHDELGRFAEGDSHVVPDHYTKDAPLTVDGKRLTAGDRITHEQFTRLLPKAQSRFGVATPTHAAPVTISQPASKPPPLSPPSATPPVKQTMKERLANYHGADAVHAELLRSSKALVDSKERFTKASDAEKAAQGRFHKTQDKMYQDIGEHGEASKATAKEMKAADKALKVATKDADAAQAAHEAVKAEHVANVERAMKSLTAKQPLQAKVTHDPSMTGEHLAKSQQAADWLLSKVEQGNTPGTVASLTAKAYNGRAFYQNEDVTVNTKPTNDASVHVHEMAHWLEYRVPGVQAAANEFLEHRCGDEPFRKMNDAIGVNIYRDDEHGRKDDFSKVFGENGQWYAGKIYKGGGTEIVSMGLEKLHKDPVQFAHADPEYFKFVVGLLKGDMRS